MTDALAGRGLDLSAIETRLKAATPGPWRAKQMNHADGDPWFFVLDADGRGPVVETVVAQTKYLVAPEAAQRADVDFIAHAPEDVAGLLAACRALREALQPFAALLHKAHRNRPDESPFYRVDDAEITVGDLRRAVGVLAQTQDSGDSK